jgi:hypothetical protein
MSRVDWSRVWPQMSMRAERGERVPTQQMLMVADVAAALERSHGLPFLADVLQVHAQGQTTAEDRLRQAIRVINWWPAAVLEAVMLFDCDVPWHSLYEPTRWDDVDKPTLVAFVLGFVERGRWPSVGEMRASGGRRRNHPLPGEQPNQTQLV